MPTYRIIVTRDVTESCVVTVSAADAAKAQVKALESVWNSPHGMDWEPDDCVGGDPYVTDCEENKVAACEGCGNTLNDGSDICDQCGGDFK
jgi:hypothetical protein